MAIPDFNFDVAADNNELDKMQAAMATEPAAQPMANINPAPAEPSDIEQRQGTSFVATPPVVQAQEQTPFSPEVDDMVKVFAETSTPQPVYDENRERRLRTMAGASGVAKALMTLGDAFALNKGGIVPRRQFSEQDPYVAQILADRQVFKDKEYAAKLQENADKLRNATTVIGMKREDRRFQAQQAQQNYENLMKEAQLKWEQGFKEESLALEKEALAEKKRAQKFSEEFQEKELKQKSALGWGQIAVDEARAAAAAAKQAGKQTVLRTPDGKIGIPLEDENDVTALYNIVRADKGIEREVMETISQNRSYMSGNNVTPAGQKVIVQQYWHRSPAAQKYLEGRGLATFGAGEGAQPTGKVGTIFTETPQE